MLQNNSQISSAIIKNVHLSSQSARAASSSSTTAPHWRRAWYHLRESSYRLQATATSRWAATRQTPTATAQRRPRQTAGLRLRIRNKEKNAISLPSPPPSSSSARLLSPENQRLMEPQRFSDSKISWTSTTSISRWLSSSQPHLQPQTPPPSRTRFKEGNSLQVIILHVPMQVHALKRRI